MRILNLVLLGAFGIGLTGCIHDQSPYVERPPTFDEYYGKLKGAEKRAAGTGYTYAQNDTMQQLYQAYSNMQHYDVPGGSRKKTVSLEKKILSVPVGPYKDSNGVIRGDSQKFIEVNTTE